MIHASLISIANQLAVSAPALDVSFIGISTDTRTLSPGNLYIAIQGEQFDGHQFLSEATANGAAAALVNRQIDCSLPQLVVPDTILAFGSLTARWRDQFNIPVIGVTGSNGKTTLKNMIATILRAACENPQHVLATEGNLNNNIGLPLNLARFNKEHRYAVLEMGMNHFGEIAYLTQLAKPTVAIINNAAEAHLEGLNDVAGVAKAKGEIFLGLAADGIAILNRDDAFFSYWQTLIGNRRFFTFGLDHPADVTADIKANNQLTLQTPKGTINVALPLLGRHNAMNALAATAATLAVGIPLSAIQTGLENIKPAPGRMNQHTLTNGATLIDDTYNANPFSLQAAINTLADTSGIKILVLGDMKELGPDTKDFHFLSGEKARAAGIDYLFTYGNLSAAATENFGNNAFHFSDQEKLIQALTPYLKKDVTVLVKGSRSMRMEKIVAGLHPDIKLAHAH